MTSISNYGDNLYVTNATFSGTAGTPITLSYNSPVGVTTKFEADIDINKKVIHPRLYFKFVKTNMTKLQQDDLRKRIKKLQQLIVTAEKLGQRAFYEELALKIAVTVKEQELSVFGYDINIDKKIIEQYKHKVKGPKVHFSKLENYTRPIPMNVACKLFDCKKNNVFDEYWILYLEYEDKLDVDNKVKKEKSQSKTNKEKIKEKDPIIFGTHALDSDKLFYIIDWVDEYCDLTLEKLIGTIKEDTPEFSTGKIEAISKEYMNKIIKETHERVDRLKNTKPSNYRDLMTEEDESYLKKAKKLFTTKSKKKK